jgi:6,7-dimethyl-8-ribityllumazine synthase
MADRSERFGTYDPFEDTGDWPFRDAPPRPEQEEERENLFAAADPVQPLGTAPPVVPEEPAGAEHGGDREGHDEGPPAAVLPAAAAPAFDEPDEEELDEDELEEGEDDVEDEDDDDIEDDGVEEAAEDLDGLEPVAATPPAVVEQHAAGELEIPEGVDVLTGAPHGFRRSVAVVVSRFNGDITTQMLEHALEALRDCHVGEDAITVVPVPGAFELPLTALALAKTRRYACVVALGCVIRGETAHFDVIAGEAASGLQLAAIETGIPVSFGVLTCDTREQAESRVERGADAARTALEMADLFSHVRTRAAQQ